MAYAPVLAMGMGLMFLRMLLMASLLEIPEFATYSAILVISGVFTAISCLGVYLHLQRALPVYLARSQRRVAITLTSQAVWVAIALCVAAMTLTASGLLGAVLDSAVVSGDVLILGALLGLSQQIFLIATTESRSNNEPLRYANQHLVRSVITVFASGTVAGLWGSAAFAIIAEAFVTFVASGLILKGMLDRFSLSMGAAIALGRRSFRRVSWATMLTLLAYSGMQAVSTQVDRWMSSILLGSEAFAQYAFAWIVMIFALSVQALINALVYPMIARKYALQGPDAAYKLALQVSSASLIAFGLAAPAGYFAAAFLVRLYFPDYQSSIALLPMIAIAAVLRVSDFWSSYALVAGLERRLVAATGLSLLVVILGWYGLELLRGSGSVDGVDLSYLCAATSAMTFLSSMAVSIHHRRSAAYPTPLAPRLQIPGSKFGAGGREARRRNDRTKESGP